MGDGKQRAEERLLEKRIRLNELYKGANLDTILTRQLNRRMIRVRKTHAASTQKQLQRLDKRWFGTQPEKDT